MCKILNISRQTYYYQAKPIENESDLEEIVQEEFIRNRKAYGTRKLKKCLAKRGLQLSRRRIGRIMKRRGLTSTYTIAHFKGQRTACNEAKTANVLDRTFTQEQPLEAIVTDLTYVRVGKKWHYICLILDLFNREIIGITRSLSRKGCPYDNAVAESTYKSGKVEFVHQYQFETLAQLRLELFDYVHWWNYLRLHGTLAYETPIQIRQQRLAKRILDNEHGSDTSGEAA